MNIVIIEDERPLATDLSRTIMLIEPKAKILQVVSSVEDAINYLPHLQNVDLIFSDIQLGDGLSFEIFTTIENHTPIVFCTAFDHYALRAFDTLGIDYLLKPISKDAVTRALDKFKRLSNSKNVNFQMGELVKELQIKTDTELKPSIIVHHKDQIIPLSTDQIALFAVEQDGVYVYTFEGNKRKVIQSLDQLENRFKPYFFRANRQFLVNRKAIVSAAAHLHRKLIIRLTIEHPQNILVGKEKVSAFLSWLSGS